MIWLTRNFDEHNHDVVSVRPQEVDPHGETREAGKHGVSCGARTDKRCRHQDRSAGMSWAPLPHPAGPPPHPKPFCGPDVSAGQAAGRGGQEGIRPGANNFNLGLTHVPTRPCISRTLDKDTSTTGAPAVQREDRGADKQDPKGHSAQNEELRMSADI